MIRPRAPMEVSAIKNTIPTLRSATTDLGAKGTTSQTAAAGKNMAIGAPRKIQRPAPWGMTFSLANSFTTPAGGGPGKAPGVRPLVHDVLFGEQRYDGGRRLHQPPRSHPVRPIPQLDVGRH